MDRSWFPVFVQPDWWAVGSLLFRRVLLWKKFQFVLSGVKLALKMVHLRTGLGGVEWAGVSRALKGSDHRAGCHGGNRRDW